MNGTSCGAPTVRGKKSRSSFLGHGGEARPRLPSVVLALRFVPFDVVTPPDPETSRLTIQPPFRSCSASSPASAPSPSMSHPLDTTRPTRTSLLPAQSPRLLPPAPRPSPSPRVLLHPRSPPPPPPRHTDNSSCPPTQPSSPHGPT